MRLIVPLRTGRKGAVCATCFPLFSILLTLLTLLVKTRLNPVGRYIGRYTPHRVSREAYREVYPTLGYGREAYREVYLTLGY